MAKKSPEEVEKTRQLLLDSALYCFADQGVTNTFLEKVAQHAGMTRGAIYWHFKNKADLFQAVHEHIELPFDYLLEQLTRHPNCNFEQFYFMLYQTLTHGLRHEKSKMLLEILVLKCEFMTEMRAALDRLLLTLTPLPTELKTILMRFQAENLIDSNINADVIAQSLLNLLHGNLSRDILNPTQFELKSFAQDSLNLFFRGVLIDPNRLPNINTTSIDHAPCPRHHPHNRVTSR